MTRLDSIPPVLKGFLGDAGAVPLLADVWLWAPSATAILSPLVASHHAFFSSIAPVKSTLSHLVVAVLHVNFHFHQLSPVLPLAVHCDLLTPDLAIAFSPARLVCFPPIFVILTKRVGPGFEY
uniref:Uncharacterized protein n=1 Tax=Romanomermis culicivorax TaxID=13658 RepID=A0A915K671_ROMCU